MKIGVHYSEVFPFKISENVSVTKKTPAIGRCRY